MLYVSTRNNTDSFTAHWALHGERTSEGGMYVPFQLPNLDSQQIAKLTELSFSETVAQILNLFFSVKLTGWDVEFSIGRYPVKLITMNHRVVVAEIWHNPGFSIDYALNHLYSRLCGVEHCKGKPSAWASIAIYIAVLFGIYVELNRSGISVSDIVIPSEDSSASVAALYARSMGLPLGSIIVGCKDSDPVWDLVQKGTLNTNSFQSAFVEQLIYHKLGSKQVQLCIQSCAQRGTYQFTQDQLKELNKGLHAIVAGDNRINAVITSAYRSNASFFSPRTALSFGCLQDYRSHTGESRSTMLLADSSPVYYINHISAATGIPVSELKRQMNLTKE